MDTIEVSRSENDARYIREKLNEYNFALVPDDDHEILNLIVRRQNTIIAGLIGDTYWNWLYVSLFWVDECERSRGLGTKILLQAEEIAIQRGCRNAHLETHDFQNLGFYQKQGYQIFGKLDDLPEGPLNIICTNIFKIVNYTRISHGSSPQRQDRSHHRCQPRSRLCHRPCPGA